MNTDETNKGCHHPYDPLCKKCFREDRNNEK